MRSTLVSRIGAHRAEQCDYCSTADRREGRRLARSMRKGVEQARVAVEESQTRWLARNRAIFKYLKIHVHILCSFHIFLLVLDKSRFKSNVCNYFLWMYIYVCECPEGGGGGGGGGGVVRTWQSGWVSRSTKLFFFFFFFFKDTIQILVASKGDMLERTNRLIIITVIVTAFKALFEIFCNLPTAPRTVSNT